MNKKNIIGNLIVIIIIAAFVFTYYKGNGYSFKKKVENNNQQEETIVAAEETLEDKVNNFFEGMEEDNYIKASKDFSDNLAEELNNEQFQKLRQLFNLSIGELVDLKTPEVSDGGKERTMLRYVADFEKESGVIIQATFSKDKKMEVIIFKSLKLDEALNKE